jgi:hypothetical protein
MPHATIQGELHGSQGDQQRLLDHDLGDYDQLFIEGRADIDIHGISLKFAIFLIGVLMIFWLERLIAVIARVYSRIFSNTDIDIRQEANQAEVPIDDEIDSDLEEIYKEFKDGGSAYMIHAIMFVLPLFSFGTLWRLILFEINQGSWTIPFTLVMLTIHMLSFVLVIGALFFVGVIILRSPNSAEREQTMARTIVDRSESNGYDRVLISCGDKHVSGITEELQDEGWTVDPNRSGHWISKFSRKIRTN